MNLQPLSFDLQAPWKRRFRAATMASGQIARDNPAWGIVCSNRGGIFQLHAWDVAAGKLRQVTHDPHGSLLGAISPDGRFIYTVLDPDGDQYGHFARLPFEGGTIQDLTPNFPQYPLAQICLSATGNMLSFAVPRPADKGTDLYVVPTGEVIGQPCHVFHDPIPGLHGRRRLALSPDGSLLIFASNERNPVQMERLFAIDTRSGTCSIELWDGPQGSVSVGDFSPIPGDTRVLVTVYRGDREQVLLWNPRTGEQKGLDWNLDGYVAPITWTPDGLQLLLYQEYEVGSRHVFYTLSDGSSQGMDYVSGLHRSATFGGDHTLYIHRGEHRPAEVLAMDILTGKVKGVTLSGGLVPPERPWRSITFPSSDGQQIQAWLITPEGEEPFPMIMYIHGGPRERVEKGYAPELQLWVDHGFAVCAVNYRGTPGFGHAFEEKIVGNPGYWELEDIVAGRNWLVEQGVARPDAILLTGWSYGGYLTLLGLGKFPDLWAGGMAGYGIADWTALDDEAADGLRISFLFGGTSQKMLEQYRISSPITYAEQVQAPLFIYHGINDPGCPPRQMKSYITRLQALGKPVEVTWIEAGHGTLDTEKEIAIQEMLLRFAYRALNANPARI